MPLNRVLFVLAFSFSASLGFAEETDAAAPVKYLSRHFELHTDLPAATAAARLQRAESALETISDYFGRGSGSRIECYLVGDLVNWQDFAFPHPLARTYLTGIGGATTNDVVTERRRRKRKAVVYCMADDGILEHEIVHAYCIETFGHFGPEWFKEGMAELAYHWCDNRELQCSPATLQSLRRDAAQSPFDIVQAAKQSSGLYDIAQKYHARTADQNRDRWNSADRVSVALARSTNDRYWALCHFLTNHPGYSKRFRSLGKSYLNGQMSDFEQVFGGQRRRIEFEFGQFLANADDGYRVDLCAWEWSDSAVVVRAGDEQTRMVNARQGYQSTGCYLTAGRSYELTGRGNWQFEGGSTAVSTAGAGDGRGRLVAVLMDDFQLSEPFEIGAATTFTAPTAGQLYVRCQEEWDALADNNGAIQLTIRLQDAAP